MALWCICTKGSFFFTFNNIRNKHVFNNLRSWWRFFVWLFVSGCISFPHIAHKLFDLLIQGLEHGVVFVLVVKGTRLAAVSDICRSTPQNGCHFPSTFSSITSMKFYYQSYIINMYLSHFGLIDALRFYGRTITRAGTCLFLETCG